jgi:hypothetical protein
VSWQGIPDGELDRAMMLQNLLVARSTGESGSQDDYCYQILRNHFMASSATQGALPDFVRASRDLGSFWGWIRDRASTYAERRGIVREAMQPLLDLIEGKHRAPLDVSASESLASFDPAGVHAVWEKALARRQTDPEGAITAARTLLETVCKHILDRAGVSYSDRDDLPKLYAEAARFLNIAPSQHTEEVFKQVLGGCHSVVQGLGTLRNRISDSHGQGQWAVRPAPRHAQLAVNLAGAMATFLVETWAARSAPDRPWIEML